MVCGSRVLGHRGMAWRDLQLHSPYRAVNTLCICVTKTSQLMLYREIIAVCSEIHTKHRNIFCGQKIELFNVKYGGT